MTVSANTAAFGEWLAEEYRRKPEYDSVQLSSGGDAAPGSLLVRLCVAPGTYYVARFFEEGNLLEVGLATEGRMLNEAIEQMILDNGGDLDELLADELCDLGEIPLPTRHFFERPTFFFVVSLPLKSATELDDPAIRHRVQVILAASRNLLQGCIDEA